MNTPTIQTRTSPQRSTDDLVTLAEAHRRMCTDLGEVSAPAHITLRKHASAGHLDDMAKVEPGRRTLYDYSRLLSKYAPSSQPAGQPETIDRADRKRAESTPMASTTHPSLDASALREILLPIVADLLKELITPVVEQLAEVAKDARNLEAARRMLMLKADEAQTALARPQQAPQISRESMEITLSLARISRDLQDLLARN